MLSVDYSGVRTNVTAKLNDLQQEMVRVYGKMINTVDEIETNQYLVGETAIAYAQEFTDLIGKHFNNLNNALEKYCMQLESLCQDMEKEDKEIRNIMQPEENAMGYKMPEGGRRIRPSQPESENAMGYIMPEGGHRIRPSQPESGNAMGHIMPEHGHRIKERPHPARTESGNAMGYIMPEQRGPIKLEP